MDFGPGSLKSFEFIPEYADNRKRPEGERIACEILRPTTAQRLAMESETSAGLLAWRDEHFKAWLGEHPEAPELKEAILSWDKGVLHVIKLVCTHTRNWRNVAFDGRQASGPAEVCLWAPLPLADSGQGSLIGETYGAAMKASSLTGEQLKNFASQCAGTSSEIIPPPTAGATASLAA